MTKEIVHALNEINLSLYELTAAERNNGTTLKAVAAFTREVADNVLQVGSQYAEEEERRTLNTSIRTLVRFCCERDCNRCIYHKAGANINCGTGEGCVLHAPFTWEIPQEDLT
jgi:hypothetical protein